MSVFYEETRYVYRLKIPFETLYTSVFLIKSLSGMVLVDCATTDEDVEGHIVPALRKMGYELPDIDKLVLTHGHGDHAGGLKKILDFVISKEWMKHIVQCVFVPAGLPKRKTWIH